MKLGLGLYRHQLTDDNLAYARQLGCTHIVVHLVDYFAQGDQAGTGDSQPIGSSGGWGVTRVRDVWSVDELATIKARIEAAGLIWAAIENFDPGVWYDILLDGPRKEAQVEAIKQLIRNLGRVGIPVMGYNFSLAGVAGRATGLEARGGAETVGARGGTDQTPIPAGMVWNMVYDPDLLGTGVMPATTHAELWDRLAWFLREVVPVAEAAGVRLALHPDDPPFPMVRQAPRLVYEIPMYQRVLDLVPSPANAIECCVGTLSEMAGGHDLYDWLETYARQGALAYLHMRNVVGTVPTYTEVFIDEGQIDVLRVFRILQKHGFDGVIIPDHTPMVTSPAPWHVGKAFSLGYLRAMIAVAEAG
ncbi:D-mannonate dehydratase [Siculibacillus lacustris]|uniref:mannonate dehydratase n=1 Tax=Siculibacillus lacustris TaxID=1549641 RepID=A0A4Q9VU25_9HYPH|nr:mannonate dehydratase [Siculibacillus lacustris]TBW39502.1 D-mannonate dehydratase [Siculibacillus lacustris]